MDTSVLAATERCRCRHPLEVSTHYRFCKKCGQGFIVFDPPPPKPPRDYATERARGDELRAQGLALPLCWLPEKPGAPSSKPAPSCPVCSGPSERVVRGGKVTHHCASCAVDFEVTDSAGSRGGGA